MKSTEILILAASEMRKGLREKNQTVYCSRITNRYQPTTIRFKMRAIEDESSV